jgi:hypothetical protein
MAIYAALGVAEAVGSAHFFAFCECSSLDVADPLVPALFRCLPHDAGCWVQDVPWGLGRCHTLTGPMVSCR